MRVTQADFARIHRVSRKTVSVWKSEGRIVLVGNLVDVEASNVMLDDMGRSRVAAGASAAAGNGPIKQGNAGNDPADSAAEPGNDRTMLASTTGNMRATSDEEELGELGPFQQGHTVGYHAGFSSGLSEIAFDLPAVARSAALAVGVSEALVDRLAIEFAKRVIVRMGVVMDLWEIRHPSRSKPWSEDPPWTLDQFAFNEEELSSR